MIINNNIIVIVRFIARSYNKIKLICMSFFINSSHQSHPDTDVSPTKIQQKSNLLNFLYLFGSCFNLHYHFGPKKINNIPQFFFSFSINIILEIIYLTRFLLILPLKFILFGELH